MHWLHSKQYLQDSCQSCQLLHRRLITSIGQVATSSATSIGRTPLFFLAPKLVGGCLNHLSVAINRNYQFNLVVTVDRISVSLASAVLDDCRSHFHAMIDSDLREFVAATCLTHRSLSFW